MPYTRPLNRSITIGCMLFIIFLGTIISIVDFVAFKRGLYERNNVYLSDLIHFIERNIDKDDLYKCAESGKMSERYNILQTFLDSVVDTYNVSYVYIMKPFVDKNAENCRVIINGITKEEYENDYENLYFLGDVTNDSFPESTIKSFFSAMEKPGTISFYEDKEESEWGYDYTGMLPLQNSSGEIFALLCADISVTSIRLAIYDHMIYVILIIAVAGFMFCAFFIIWSRTNITHPVLSLEKSVSEFARLSHEQSNPEKLIYRAPDIQTKNEVESLSCAITQMTNDIKTYAKNIIETELKLNTLQQNIEKLDVLAYQDSLTHVKNKTAYDSAVFALNAKINRGIARFAIVMIDLNYLKRVNDNYGHERGNEYLTGACQIICDIFQHSPVFRIGGDEFAVILEWRDYDKRHELYQILSQTFKEFESDENRDPWLRFSAACGMATYNIKTNRNAESVFKDADKIMYENKIQMHACR